MGVNESDDLLWISAVNANIVAVTGGTCTSEDCTVSCFFAPCNACQTLRMSTAARLTLSRTRHMLSNS